MTGTQPDSRGETIIVKQIQTLHLCIWKIMTWEAAQLKPGYNIQIGGDSQYIVSADIFQDQNTVWTLVKKQWKRSWSFVTQVWPRIRDMKAKKATRIWESRSRHHTFIHRPMRNGKIQFKQDINKWEHMEYEKTTDIYLSSWKEGASAKCGLYARYRSNLCGLNALSCTKKFRYRWQNDWYS